MKSSTCLRSLIPMPEIKIRCAGDFADDRTCDLCRIVAPDVYEACVALTNLKADAVAKIADARKKCPHCRNVIVDWEYCTLCMKGTCGVRSAPACVPTEECLNDLGLT